MGLVINPVKVVTYPEGGSVMGGFPLEIKLEIGISN